jgi:benzoate membrane transport protein
MRASLFSSALVAALVGYGSTIALVLAAAAAVSATPTQTASWVVAVCLAKAAGSLILSVWTRIPMVLAWSTPGAALVAASSGLTMPEAVGAFVLAGLLILLTGLIRPLGHLVAMIPDGIAAGMLAGVLLPFVLRLAPSMHDMPVLVGAMAAVFVIVRLWNPAMAVLAALTLGLAMAFGTGAAEWPALSLPWPTLELTVPAIRIEALLGLGLPLYLVTMASQNLPGFATLRAAGYEPPVRKALAVTGGLSALSALWGAHTISMAAITAAICLGDDVHPDRDARWRVGVIYAGVWVGLAVLGPVILALLGALPPGLMAAIVALALLGPLTGAMAGAMAQPPQRFASVVTLTVTASGVVAFGIGAAFWGLAAGILVLAAENLRRQA